MLVFIATSIFIVALFPIIYFLIIRDQTTKAFPFAVFLIIIFASFFLYFNKGTAIGSFSEYLVLTEINQDISANTALSPVSLTNSVTNLSQDEKAIFINQLFQDALQQNSLESAASLLAFANSVLQDGEYQSILLLMYADLRADEKIGLGSHKLKQYSKRYPNADFRFSYMLNECFWNSSRYEDTYEIMSEEGIGFFFVGGENAAMRKTTLTNNTKKKVVYFPAKYRVEWEPIFEHIHVRAPPLF